MSTRRLAELRDGTDVSRPTQQPGDPQVEAEPGGGVDGPVDSLVLPDRSCPQGGSGGLARTTDWVFGRQDCPAGEPGNKHKVETSGERGKTINPPGDAETPPHCGRGQSFPARPPSAIHTW